MNRLRRLVASVVAVTSTTEPASALAAFRIGVGLSLLLLLLPLLLTAAGRDVVRFAFCDVDRGGYRDLAGTFGTNLFGGASPSVELSLMAVAAASALLMVLGLFGRVPVLVAAVTTRIALSQNMDVSGAGDALIGNALLLLLFGDVTATWSLDCKWRTGSFVDDTPVPAWPRKLAVVQVCIMYTTTGLQKLVSTAWTPLDGFSALYQILQSPHWARFPDLIDDTGRLLAVPLAVMTAVTIVWECFFFVVLWNPRVRLVFVVIGVAVHLGIYALMEVGIFSIIAMATYPVLFSPTVIAVARRWMSTAGSRLWRLRR